MAKTLTLKTVFQAIDKMSGPMKTITSKTERLGKVAQGIGKAMAWAGAAAVASGYAVGRAAIAFAERGDDIARNAAILGLTASAYQELGYAAKMADIDQEAFASATKKLNKNLGDLKLGTGTLYLTLSKSNPALAKQLRNAKDTGTAFDLMAEAIAKETNVQKRAALAVAAFGRAGQDMIPMLSDLAKLRDEARRSGTIISDADVKAAERLDDAWKRLKAQGMSLANTALAGIADKLSVLADKASEWVSANRDTINLKLEEVFTGIGRAFEILTAPGVLQGIAALAVGIKAVGVASMIFGAGNPMVLAIAGIAALITLIVANWDKITGFFDRMANSAATGEGRYSKIANAPGGARGYDEPGSSLAPAVSSYSESRSMVDINFGNVPAGTRIDQRGNAPGVSLNLGQTMGAAFGGAK